MSSPNVENLHRKRFIEALYAASKSVKSQNLTTERYNEIVNRLEELENDSSIKTDQDRQRLKRYKLITKFRSDFY